MVQVQECVSQLVLSQHAAVQEHATVERHEVIQLRRDAIELLHERVGDTIRQLIVERAIV